MQDLAPILVAPRIRLVPMWLPGCRFGIARYDPPLGLRQPWASGDAPLVSAASNIAWNSMKRLAMTSRCTVL